MADVAVSQQTQIYEPSLFGTYSKKIGMWLFLLSDSLTFGALLFAYTYGRVSTPNWPTPFHSESIRNATLMTAFLLTSSLTMVLAVRAAVDGRAKAQRLWLLATMACGSAFVILHGREWTNLIAEGLTLPMFPVPPGTSERRIRQCRQHRASIPRYLLRADRHAHAACDHRRDLSGSGGAAKEIHSHSSGALAGGLAGNAGLQPVSLWRAFSVAGRDRHFHYSLAEA